MSALPRLLLCTDMDRTVIPNGAQPEHPDARRRFKAFCSDPRVTLVYVSGRHLSLVKQAIADFDLPQADFAITDVGTRIYRMNAGAVLELESWQAHIDEDWQGLGPADLKMLLGGIDRLREQEADKQNRHKLSFYLELGPDNEAVLASLHQALANADLAANVLWSIDEVTATGLVDVLPQRANKLHAIEFLRQALQYELDDVVFAGDSGNDMEVLVSEVPAVLVNNATGQLKQEACTLAATKGNSAMLYLAGAHPLMGMNGNYSAGVLEGVWHFLPAFRALLEQD